jgi:hypothetical protein
MRSRENEPHEAPREPGATLELPPGATFEPDPKTDYPRKPTPPTHAAS